MSVDDLIEQARAQARVAPAPERAAWLRVVATLSGIAVARKASLPKGENTLVSPRRAATLLGVPEKTVHAWVRERALPFLAAGKTIRFRAGELLAFVRDRGLAPEVLA